MNKPLDPACSSRPRPSPTTDQHRRAHRRQGRGRAHDDGARVGISRPHESARAARGRRSAPTSTTSPSSPARCTARSACRRWRTAGSRTSDLDAIRAMPGVVAVLIGRRHPGQQRLRLDRPRRPDPRATARSATSASRCSRWSPRPATRRAARAAPAKDALDIEAEPPVLTPQDAHAQGPVRAAADAPGAQHERGGAQAAIAARAASPEGRARRRRPGAVLPRRPDQLRDPASEGGGDARALLDPASERDAAPGGARAAACRPTRCTWNAGAWAAASAARSRSRPCSPASPRWPRSKLQRPVKLRLDRDDDFMITGRRHCFWYEYEVGYDDERPHPRRRDHDGLARRPSRPTCRAR